MDEQRLVELYRAHNTVEAHLLKSALENEGIRAVIDGEMLQGGLGDLPLGWPTSPRVMVRERDLPKARTLVDKHEHLRQSAPASSDGLESSASIPSATSASQVDLSPDALRVASQGASSPIETDTPMLLGLRTVVYYVEDLENATLWYTQLLGYAPYFKEPFYVGFNVGGFELGLHPDITSEPKIGSTHAYWGVADARKAQKRLLAMGAKIHEDIQEVGGGILVATVLDPWGNLFGIIENPHFQTSP